MKTNTLFNALSGTIITLAANTFAYAQIVIPESQVMPLGMNHNVGITDAGSSPELIFTENIAEGENIEWDFSTLEAVLEQNLKVVPIAQAPFGNALLGNKVLLRNDGDVDSQYLLAINDALLATGHVDGEGVKLPYAPGEMLAMFPMTTGQTYNGEFADQVTFYVGEPLGTAYVVDSVRSSSITEYSYHIHSYGTLHLPQGSYQVLLQEVVKHIATVADFFRQDTQEWVLGADMLEMDLREFIFWSNDAGYPMLRLRDIGDVGFIMDMEWVTDQSLSAPTQQAQAPAIRIFPNPANDHVFINGDFHGNTQIQIYSTTGALVREYNAQESPLRLELIGLQPGIYMVRVLHDGGNEAVGKFAIFR